MTYARATRLAAVMALAGTVSACATVVRGTNTAWNVQTTPSGAAVSTSNGRGCEATPCLIRMPRKSEFTATLTKPGYETTSVSVGHDVSPSGLLALRAT